MGRYCPCHGITWHRWQKQPRYIIHPFLSVSLAHPLAPPFFLVFLLLISPSFWLPWFSPVLTKTKTYIFLFLLLLSGHLSFPGIPFLHHVSLFCPFLSLSPSSFSLSHSYESTQEILPGSPRLTSFPTVSGSPASLASSMDAVSKATRSSPCRRRLQSTALM